MSCLMVLQLTCASTSAWPSTCYGWGISPHCISRKIWSFNARLNHSFDVKRHAVNWTTLMHFVYFSRQSNCRCSTIFQIIKTTFYKHFYRFIQFRLLISDREHITGSCRSASSVSCIMRLYSVVIRTTNSLSDNHAVTTVCKGAIVSLQPSV